MTAANDYTARYSDDNGTDDLITEELTDDAAVDLGVTHAELRDGLDKLAGHDPDIPVADQGEAADDMEQAIEDADEQER